MHFDSELKLFYHLYRLIVGGQIRTFAALVDAMDEHDCSFIPDKVLMHAFRLIKELHWGFFKDITREQFPRLWSELVLPHRTFPEAGDLKRNTTISAIYVALLDIHGYTKFCQESKRNLSRMRKLDEFLHAGVRRIAGRNQAVGHRERGDEIIVIAASATDAVKTTLEIIDSFSRRSMLKGIGVERDREESQDYLPDFRVSAGIAGGNLTTPLIITESGLLSGFLINTAARLQSRANELAPTESKCLVTLFVYKAFQKDGQLRPQPIHQKGALAFLDHGTVAFKGVSVATYEVLFRKKDRYRAKYDEQLTILYDSVKKGRWKERIFGDLIALLIRVYEVMPAFSVKASLNGKSMDVTNTELIELCKQARELYESRDDYRSAVRLLRDLRSLSGCVETLDRLVLDYLDRVGQTYDRLVEEFEGRLDVEIQARLETIFKPELRAAYLSAKRGPETLEKLRTVAYRSNALRNRKAVWYKLIEDAGETLNVEVYSGKK
jgi:class 3 adenylate cyclase